MQELGTKNPAATLADLGIQASIAHWNLSVSDLTAKTVELGQGSITDMGALAVSTGKFTGRSPKDKFTVMDSITEGTVAWGDINIGLSTAHFDALHQDIVQHLTGKELFVRDAYACADPKHRLNIRVVNETPWANLFCND
jgi:phosphoenolpyruvate carboxykinase (ATP)